MTPKKPKAPAIAEKKGPEITKKRGGARPNTGGKRPGAGRPPGSPNKVTASVREAAQVHSDEAVNTLAAIMKDGKAPAALIALSEAMERSRMERRAIMERRRQMGFTGD